MHRRAVLESIHLVGRPTVGGYAATALGVLCLLMLWDRWNPSVPVWQSPTPAFMERDIDRDEEISREEWESAYGTNASTRAVLEFDWGDCNRNGRLTWEEYFRVRVKRNRCQTAPLELFLHKTGQIALHDEVTTPIVSAKDIHLARVSLMRNRQRLIAAKFHEDYTEQEMVPGRAYLHTLSCSDIEQLEIPQISQDFRQFSRLAVLEPGLHPGIRCTVSNGSDYTFTYLQLRLTTLLAEGSAHVFHGKTLWVPPRESRDLWIFPDREWPVTKVSLVKLRVKRD